jgi:hypothetical protein
VTVNVETQQQRRMTLAEIGAAPTTMTLQRQGYIDDLSGGRKPNGAPATLRSQRVTIISPTQQLPERRTLAGITVQPEFLIKGRWDADIQRGDWYFISGVKYEVVYVDPDRRYQTKAEVVYLG